MLFRTGTPTATKGNAAEALAEQFLQQHGLQTLCKNYRCRAGEIDLIMQHHNTLVFIEVRLRSNARFCSAAESVDQRKQQKILRTAQFYLQQQRLTDAAACRFDVVALSHTHSTPEWIQNAFGC